MRQIGVVFLAVLAIAGIAAGCGKKGSLEPPPGYSAPAQTDKADKADKTSEDGKQKPADE